MASLKKTLLVGWCAEFALVYKEAHGGVIFGFVRKSIEYVEEGLVHAFVRTADGLYVDAEGPHSLEEIQAKWLPRGLKSWDYSARLMRLTKTDISKRWGIDARGIGSARKALRSSMASVPIK